MLAYSTQGRKSQQWNILSGVKNIYLRHTWDPRACYYNLEETDICI